MEERFVKRGEIYWADIPVTPNSHVQSDKRPILVIQNDKGNTFSPTVIGAFLTTSEKKKYPMHLDIMLNRKSKILFEQVITIDKKALREKVGELSKKEMLEADRIIGISLGIDQYSLLSIKKIQITEKILIETLKGVEFKVRVVVSVGEELTPLLITLDEAFRKRNGITYEMDLAEMNVRFNTLDGAKFVLTQYYKGKGI